MKLTFLISGDTSNYDWDSGYTCHQLGSGSICVQLGQPYAIESMKYAYSEQSIFFRENNFLHQHNPKFQVTPLGL